MDVSMGYSAWGRTESYGPEPKAGVRQVQSKRTRQEKAGIPVLGSGFIKREMRIGRSRDTVRLQVLLYKKLNDSF